MQLTLKRAMEYVFDDANDQFPNGWETPLAEIYRKTGYEHYDHKQRKVWELTIRTPYNGEAPTTVICRRLEKAKELMEEDIRETLAIMESRGKFCHPLVDWQGSLHWAESWLCPAFAHVTEDDATIAEKAHTDILRGPAGRVAKRCLSGARPCGLCAGYRKLLANNEPKYLLAKLILGVPL